MTLRVYCRCYINLYADDTELDVILTDFEVVLSHQQRGIDAIRDWISIDMLKLMLIGNVQMVSDKSIPAGVY